MPERRGQGLRLYFAYGSNLSLEQMRARCPDSTFYCYGYLDHYCWRISSRGYANIIPSGSPKAPEYYRNAAPSNPGDKPFPYEQPDYLSQVHGMLYELSEEDEKRLDRSEGVPHSYEKVYLDINLLFLNESQYGRQNFRPRCAVANALVYINKFDVVDGVCRAEYVTRMNRGIMDARASGMSDDYIDLVLRQYVPDKPIPKNLLRPIPDPFAPGKRRGRLSRLWSKLCSLFSSRKHRTEI